MEIKRLFKSIKKKGGLRPLGPVDTLNHRGLGKFFDCFISIKVSHPLSPLFSSQNCSSFNLLIEFDELSVLKK